MKEQRKPPQSFSADVVWTDEREGATPFWQVGNPHPRWYDKNGKRLPAYESLMLTAGYDAELPYEQGR